MSETIEIKLVETEFGSPAHCTVCDREAPVVARLAVFHAPFFFCRACLEAGELGHWLAERASRLEADARALRSAIVGRLPSPEQWQAKIEQREIRHQAQERLRECEQEHRIASRDDVAKLLVDPRFIPIIDCFRGLAALFRGRNSLLRASHDRRALGRDHSNKRNAAARENGRWAAPLRRAPCRGPNLRLQTAGHGVERISVQVGTALEHGVAGGEDAVEEAVASRLTINSFP